MIKGYIEGQRLQLFQDCIVSGSVDYLTARFKFQSADWDGYAKYACFEQGDMVHQIELDENNELTADKHLNLTAGEWHLVILGIKGGSKIPTNPATIKVDDNGLMCVTFDEIPLDVTEQIIAKVNDAVTLSNEAKAIAGRTDADASRAEQAAEDAELSNRNAQQQADKAQQEADKSQQSAVNSANSQADSNQSKVEAQQALADLLRMLGTDIATLVDGKIPVSQIPSIATTEIYTAASKEEQDAVQAQNGDILIRTDENKSYIYKDTGWVFLVSPTDFASKALHADTADTAENANKINNHRLVEIGQAEWNSAVKDPNTYYLVFDADAEVIV